MKTGQTLANFELVKNNIRRIEKEVLVYDINDVIGAAVKVRKKNCNREKKFLYVLEYVPIPNRA